MENQQPLYLYAVGNQILPPGPEGTLFELTSGGPILVIKYFKPTASERRSVKNDVFQIKLSIVDDVIFILFRFGIGQWMDAPYNAKLSNYELYAPQEGYGLLLHIMLVDASTGVLQVNRAIGLSTEFSTLLLHAATQQPYLGTLQEYNARIARIYSRLSTTDLLRYEVKME